MCLCVSKKNVLILLKTLKKMKKIVTAEDYIDSLRNRHLKVYLFGELVEDIVAHPMIRPSINAVAETYHKHTSNL
jgi:aromatic ring hydroxylase